MERSIDTLYLLYMVGAFAICAAANWTVVDAVTAGARLTMLR
jgi:hypothetical protein